jgi:hypothetical protein
LLIENHAKNQKFVTINLWILIIYGAEIAKLAKNRKFGDLKPANT